jgi:hypothetical protein
VAVILDYKGRDAGAALPPWVGAYLDSGIRGVEALGGYEDWYAFVAGQEGTNTGLLELWLRSFSIDQDFSRLAAARIRRRFIGHLTRSGDDEYGGNYEAAVKAAYSRPFLGGWKETDSWVLVEDSAGNREYRYLILVFVSRPLLENQINEMLSGVRGEGASRDQNTAFNRVKDAFFEGF